MNATTTCPIPAKLQEYLLGRMSDTTAAAIEEHLASCPECRKRLPTIKAEDAFVADFRAQAGHSRRRTPFSTAWRATATACSPTCRPRPT